MMAPIGNNPRVLEREYPKTRNPVREQDRAEDLLDNWRKYRYVMFPQQRAIYEQIADAISTSREPLDVLEAGCGSGQGTAILDQECLVTGTDKVRGNVDFAKCLYPWIHFEQWDIEQPWDQSGRVFSDWVIAVEVIEHVADPQAAIRNLIHAAHKEVWISTPNGKGKPRPPENPFHVCEYTVREMLDMFERAGVLNNADNASTVDVLGWEDFEPVPLDTDVSPLVYRIQLR